MNPILEEDIKTFQLSAEIADKLKNKIMVVTGATGFIGSCIVKYLQRLNLGIRFILPVRSKDKAEVIFSDSLDFLEFYQTDLIAFFNNREHVYDYIIHCASPTNGHYMVDHPAETFLLAIDSTKTILECARNNGIEGIVYVSSIEYYGQIFDNRRIDELQMGEVDHTSNRSSYALGKQAAEYLCYSYAQEFGVPVKIARLTQIFGAGVSKDDTRVFAQFARSVLSSSNIVLHTEGKSAKPYCYISDCIKALLYILIKGGKGEAYNVATPDTFVSIKELAHIFKLFNQNIEILLEPASNTGYAPHTTVNMDSSKLLALGWEPRYDLKRMVGRLIEYLKYEA